MAKNIFFGDLHATTWIARASTKRRPGIRGWIGALCVTMTAPLSAAAAGFAPPTAHEGAQISIVASGLHDPRGMGFGPKSELYVAEAGTTQGVFVPPPPPFVDPATQTRTRCFVDWPVGPATPGYTGRISKVTANGKVVVVTSGLPSFSTNTLIGGDRMGASAVAFAGDRLYALTPGGGCSHAHPTDPNAFIRVFRNGDTAPIYDLGDYLRTHPDSKSPLDGDFEPDGTWYSLIHAFGAFYTMEPNHGVMVRLQENGALTEVANLWESVAKIDSSGDGDKTYTALIQHGGAFYIGTLGRITHDFTASVYRLSRDGTRIEQVAQGLHGVVGLAFDKRNRLYVLETTAAGVSPPLLDPTKGRLVRVETNGSLTEIVTGLAFPSALLAGKHGEFYVANCGYHCDDRSAFPAALTSLQNGQILKVTIPDSPAESDDDES